MKVNRKGKKVKFFCSVVTLQGCMGMSNKLLTAANEHEQGSIGRGRAELYQSSSHHSPETLILHLDPQIVGVALLPLH